MGLSTSEKEMTGYTPKMSGEFFAGYCPESGPTKMTCCNNPSIPILTMNTPDQKIWECVPCMKEYFWIKPITDCNSQKGVEYE